ncbi:MAG: PIN domain-containing protein [Thermodesulfovibrionales bacterium]
MCNADVFVPKAVIAELIQGAKSEKEIKIIEDFLTVFNIIDSMPDTWVKAGKLSFHLKKKSLTLALMDCYIAVLAMEYGCSILTLDKHFKDIRKLTGVDLV